MDELLKDLAVAAVSSIVTVLAEAAVEAVKERASRKAGKHVKRP